MRAGVIVLNGTSSVGKTTIAGELQRRLREPFLHTGIDHFLERVPRQLIGAPQPGTTRGWEVSFVNGALVSPPSIKTIGYTIIEGMYRAIAAYSSAGNSVIVDDVIYDQQVAALARATLPEDTYWIGLDCDLAEAEHRERERLDRAPGGARTFHGLVHRYTSYDIRLDVTSMSPHDAAASIAAAYEQAGHQHAG